MMDLVVIVLAGVLIIDVVASWARDRWRAEQRNRVTTERIRARRWCNDHNRERR